MVDLDDIALAGALGSMLTDETSGDKAIRKWFESLPPETQARLVPLNPKIAESLMRTGRDMGPAEYVAALRAWPTVPHRESERRPPPSKFRPRAPLVMLFAIAITFVGMLLQFPGTCLVVVGRTMLSWAEGQEEE